MKRKCAHRGASQLTCRSQSKYWSYLLKQRVAVDATMKDGRGVERGGAPRQFPTYRPFGEPKDGANYIKIGRGRVV